MSVVKEVWFVCVCVFSGTQWTVWNSQLLCVCCVCIKHLQTWCWWESGHPEWYIYWMTSTWWVWVGKTLPTPPPPVVSSHWWCIINIASFLHGVYSAVVSLLQSCTAASLIFTHDNLHIILNTDPSSAPVRKEDTPTTDIYTFFPNGN